jgi:hypothetical protein
MFGGAKALLPEIPVKIDEAAGPWTGHLPAVFQTKSIALSWIGSRGTKLKFKMPRSLMNGFWSFLGDRG